MSNIRLYRCYKRTESISLLAVRLLQTFDFLSLVHQPHQIIQFYHLIVFFIQKWPRTKVVSKTFIDRTYQNDHYLLPYSSGHFCIELWTRRNAAIQDSKWFTTHQLNQLEDSGQSFVVPDVEVDLSNTGSRCRICVKGHHGVMSRWYWTTMNWAWRSTHSTRVTQGTSGRAYRMTITLMKMGLLLVMRTWIVWRRMVIVHSRFCKYTNSFSIQQKWTLSTRNDTASNLTSHS